jgi:hypothetical protein
MTGEEDRLRVLKLIEDGKISAAEGTRMLCCPGEPAIIEPAELKENGSSPRWIRVLVTDIDTGKARVNVKLPVNLVSTGIKMGAHLSSEMQELNIQQINDYVKRGITGQVLEVVDDEEGEKVAIYLE